jgi:SAM-dependent methyltransferase
MICLANEMRDLGTSYRESFQTRERAADYEAQYAGGTYGALEWNLEQYQLKKIASKFLTNGIRRYLDFACGTGRLTQYFATIAKTSVGIDISAAMIKTAQAKCPNVNFVIADISKSSDLDELGPFDFISIFRFLAPAEPALRVSTLKVLTAHLARDGLLLINNNANAASLLYLTLVLKRCLSGLRLRDLVEYRQSMSFKVLRRLLRESNLEIVETRGVCYFPSHLTSRLPKVFWYPLERLLGYLNLFPSLAVNQIVVARKKK